MKTLLNGFLTGLLLQVAVGPVFFFILNTTLQKTAIDGLLGVLAVTLADCLYIFLAVAGVGRLLERPRIKRAMQVASSVVLAAFGAMMIAAALNGPRAPAASLVAPSSPLASFASALLLTLSSPLTIVFWTSLFAAKAIEKGYRKRQLVPFGLGAGASTAVFLGLVVAACSLARSSIPDVAVGILNGIVGAVLVIYGIVRFAASFRASGSGAAAGRPTEE